MFEQTDFKVCGRLCYDNSCFVRQKADIPLENEQQKEIDKQGLTKQITTRIQNVNFTCNFATRGVCADLLNEFRVCMVVTFNLKELHKLCE